MDDAMFSRSLGQENCSESSNNAWLGMQCMLYSQVGDERASTPASPAARPPSIPSGSPWRAPNHSVGKHDKQRELNFWNYHHKKHHKHLPEVATVSTGHRASPRVVLAPVESLLRPWQAQTDKICEQAT